MAHDYRLNKSGVGVAFREYFEDKTVKEIQLENGAIPTYFNFEKDGKTPIISDDLIDSASSGAPLMFLTEYYKISNDKTIIPIFSCDSIVCKREILSVTDSNFFIPL